MESKHTPPERGHRPGDIEPLLEEVQDLSWSLLDEVISDNEFARLEQVLLDEEEARRTYLDCVQLHVDLLRFYGEEPEAASVGGRSVLGFLDGGTPPVDAPPTHSKPNA